MKPTRSLRQTVPLLCLMLAACFQRVGLAAPPPTIPADAATTAFVQPVELFVAALKARDLRLAYRQFDGPVHRHPRAGMASFEAFLRANPALERPGEFEVIEARPHRGIGIVEGRLQPAGGGPTQSVHFELDQEDQGGRWGIHIIMPQGGGQFPKALIAP